MKSLMIAAACGALALAGAAEAQEAGRAAVVHVTGEGRVMVAPDRFTLLAEVEGRGDDQATAIRLMAEKQFAVSQAVSRLEGLTSSEYSTGTPVVAPIYGGGCDLIRTAQASDCTVTGYVATLSMTLEASPVERAGDALSLAAERGAKTARLTPYWVSNSESARRDARRAAFNDARRQADEIAEATGQRVVRVVRAESPDTGGRVSGFVGANLIDERLGLYAFGEYEEPETGIAVTPAPIAVTERLKVIFEIE